jgi:copper chaperone CopZ
MAQAEIRKQYYEAIGAKNINILVNMDEIKKQLDNPPPNPDLVKIQLEAQRASDDYDIKLKDQEIRENEAIARIQNIEADTNLKIAQTVKSIADAEAVEPGQQLQQYTAWVNKVKADQQHDRELKKIGIEQEMDSEKSEKEASNAKGNGTNTQRGPGGMAPSPSDQANNGSLAPSENIPAGAGAVGTNLDNVLSGSNGDANYAGIGQDLRTEFNSGIEPGRVE